MLPKEERVKITIYNSLGQMVQVLADDYENAGSHVATFNGSNFASGVYYYRIEAGSFTAVRKMLLIK